MRSSLLSVVSLPKLAIKDGLSGAYARLFLPFYTYGYWFASGQQYVWPNSELVQDQAYTFNGTTKPDTFMKDCCDCNPDI